MQLLKAQKHGLLSSSETLINYQEALRFMLAAGGTKLVIVTVFILSYFTNIHEASIFSVSPSDKYYTWRVPDLPALFFLPQASGSNMKVSTSKPWTVVLQMRKISGYQSVGLQMPGTMLFWVTKIRHFMKIIASHHNISPLKHTFYSEYLLILFLSLSGGSPNHCFMHFIRVYRFYFHMYIAVGRFHYGNF